MTKEKLLYGAIGIVIGALISGITAMVSVNNNYFGVMRAMGMHVPEARDESGHMSISLQAMTDQLHGKRGDALDRAFLEMMIPHHQAAIDMAQLTKQHAHHKEVKDLADAIITTQSKEISKMKGWQMQWGYSSTEPSLHMHEH